MNIRDSCGVLISAVLKHCWSLTELESLGINHDDISIMQKPCLHRKIIPAKLVEKLFSVEVKIVLLMQTCRSHSCIIYYRCQANRNARLLLPFLKTKKYVELFRSSITLCSLNSWLVSPSYP